MQSVVLRITLGILVLLDAACATRPPFELQGVAHNITPSQVVANFPGEKGKRVVWGGVVVSAKNQPDVTELEILAYPLTFRLMPDTDRPPQIRFLVRYPGYLETVDYAPGRLVSVLGVVSDVVEGKIGDSVYHYPLLRAEKLHLWEASDRSESRFYFGIGVMLHN